MAVQFNCEELSGCKDYLFWMQEKICQNSAMRGDEEKEEVKNLQRSSEIVSQSENFGDITREMFATDFICWDEAIKDDKIRVTDAMELRRKYADEVGSLGGKTEREMDRIWKSIHGKCSVLELILSICYRLDEMVNEDEPGEMVGLFFSIFVHNLGLDISREEADLEEEKDDRKAKIQRFIQRGYNPDGSGGGLFPLKNWSSENGDKDQRKVPIWFQMNTWLNEHLDEEEHFVE